MRKIVIFALLWALIFTVEVTAAQMCTRPKEFIGVKARAEAQVKLARASGTPFFASATEIERLAEAGKLVKVTSNPKRGYIIRDLGVGSTRCSYPVRWRPYLAYAQPVVPAFLEILGEEFLRGFGQPLEITGLGRTEHWQKRLLACGITTVAFSPHQWGYAFDISKKNLGGRQLCWLWRRFFELQEEHGVVTVVDERTNIHVTVHPDFVERMFTESVPEHFPIGFVLGIARPHR